MRSSIEIEYVLTMKRFIIIILFTHSAAQAFQAVDLNLASSEQLAILPGISMRVAEQIVTLRTKRGSFFSLQDLAAIDGMSAKKIAAIKHHVTITHRKSSKPPPLPAPKTPLFMATIIPIAQLEEAVINTYDLLYRHDRSREYRVRKSAFLPKISAYFDVDRGESSTKKNLTSFRNDMLTRGDHEFGFGIKADFDLEKLIFNKDELEVAKLSLKRQEHRDQILQKLHDYYFRFQKLAQTLLDPSDAVMRSTMMIDLQEIAAWLDSMSQGAFTHYLDEKKPTK